MDVFKKIIALGLFLLVFCLLVETTGLCKFAKMFPTQRENDCILRGKNKTNNNKTATNVGKTFSENVTTAIEGTYPVRYKISHQAVTDHLLEDATAAPTDEHITTS
ncbi:hypothetical protein HOLleu_41905 [Holothuria leucospilota]|uniref:Uncharacterized protein n=1 Tax=Holothuria leucospilota TaxID=206669 RepID=A0A9Q0YC33_HOLLE|nr:hypothetical protein HOLleu_41905 [Holothuria leucospilota]